jgi:cell division protein FtsB
MRRAAWPLLASVMLVGVLFLFVFPTRTYIHQRDGLEDARHRVEVLSDQNRQLASRVKKLNTDTEIERLAREQYNLVRPGEEAYAILPAPQASPPTTAPGAKAKAEDEAKKAKPRGLVATIVSWFS